MPLPADHTRCPRFEQTRRRAAIHSAVSPATRTRSDATPTVLVQGGFTTPHRRDNALTCYRRVT